jgi:hypothetical protein
MFDRELALWAYSDLLSWPGSSHACHNSMDETPLQTIKGVLAAARLGREGPDSNPKGSFPTFWKERFRLTHVKCSLSGRLDKNVVIFALESVEN